MEEWSWSVVQNPSIERTASSVLRTLPAAAQVKRSAACPCHETSRSCLPEDEAGSGGRASCAVHGALSSFVIPSEGEYLGVIATRCPGPVAPGDEAEVEFGLVYHPNVDYRALRARSGFEMREGARAVATGRVERRLD